MRAIRAGYVLAIREFRRLVWDPAAVLSIVVAPFLLAVLAGVSLGAPVHPDATIAIAGVPAGQLPVAPAGSEVRVVAVRAERADETVRSGEAAAAIVVPANVADPVRVVADQHAKLAGEIATSIARTIELRRGVTNFTPANATIAPIRHRALHGIELYGPVASVFFVLFGVGFVSRSLHAERLDGTLARIL
ncbi:MAG TPA: hypothetical protein VFR41_02260, partial [Acidimicrobiia bacterium]|nr:hypothetical protein [Acidimicrobiia bacterium]